MLRRAVPTFSQLENELAGRKCGYVPCGIPQNKNILLTEFKKHLLEHQLCTQVTIITMSIISVKK